MEEKKKKKYNLDIKKMSRSQLYQNMKRLAVELGIPQSDIRPLYRRGNTQFFRNLVNQYTREIRNRDRNRQRAINLSSQYEIPLRNLDINTNYRLSVWRREVRRIQMRVRRSENRQREQRLRIINERQERINQAIENNRFQEVLDIVINENTTLTNQQTDLFTNNLLNELERITLSITYDGIIRIVMLNRNSGTIEFLKRILIQGFVEDIEEEFGSDIIDNINVSQITNLVIGRLERPSRIIENKDGKYFDYINETNIDLSRYQIFNENQIVNNYENKNIREHCLIQSLILNGVEENDIQSIKSSYLGNEEENKTIITRNIPKKDLHSIAIKLGRNIIVYKIHNDKKQKQIYKCGVENKNNIEIAMYKNHYFVYEDTQFTSKSIDKYNELKDIENFKDIIRVKFNRRSRKQYFYRDAKANRIDSLRTVHRLFKQGFFKKSHILNLTEESQTVENIDKKYYLENIQNEQRECKVKELKGNNGNIWFGDYECLVNEKYDNHLLYLLGFVSIENNNQPTILNVCDYKNVDLGCNKNGRAITPREGLIHDFLSIITEKGDAIVYFHNLKYDFHIMEKYLTLQNNGLCRKGTNYYRIICNHFGKKIEFRCSMKMINYGLSEFQKKLNLPKKLHKKEAIAYEYYTEENNNEIVNINEYKKFLNQREKENFNKLIKENKINSYNSVDKTFNPLEYYIEYLNLDCLVLKAGMKKLDKLVNENVSEDLSIFDHLTISSMTDYYMYSKGVYDNIFEMTGNLRDYVASSVIGGRVSVNPLFQAKVIKGKISDYDGVSLYPSAIYRLCKKYGLPIGKAVRFTSNQIKDMNGYLLTDKLNLYKNVNDNIKSFISEDKILWEKMDYSTLTIKITKVNKFQQMPFIAHKNKGSIKYLNECPENPIVIDKYTLQDYIKFHQIEYEIIDGVYWNNGFNKTMGDVIEDLFNSRLYFKKHPTLKAVQLIFKLMLNVSYGKTILKKSNEKFMIINKEKWIKNKKTGRWVLKNKDNFKNYLYNNFRTIKEYRKLNDKQYLVKRMCKDDSYNRAHIGSSILSMSKRIMNEVFDICNTQNFNVYYTDTDSIHLDYKDLEPLKMCYNKKYNRVLDGENMGQFNSDFEIEGMYENAPIYSNFSVFLAKKCYYDHIVSTDKEGKELDKNHVRLKGITEKGFKNHCKKYFDNDYKKFFTSLIDTNQEIVLNPVGEKPSFEFKHGNVYTRRQQFKRTLCFKN